MNKFEETLKEIEAIEKNWRYNLSDEEDKKHLFGRVPEDGREVALWSVPRSTGEFLKFMVELTNPKTILELGCSAGYSTLFLAKAAQKVAGHVYTTEILPEKIMLAKKHFEKAGLERQITLFERDIVEVLKEWDQSKKLDLIFMDADKEKYLQYLEMILPLLSVEGLIIVDNAGKVRMSDGRLLDSEHIQKFVKEVQSNAMLNSVFLDFDNGVLLLSKN